MNNREYFHESVVKDIVDIITSAKEYDEVQFILNRNNHRSFKSISAASKDLILTFPMLVSADLSPESVSMAAKAHEKKCAAMLHILFTAICVGENEDVYEFVKKFHNNLSSLDATLDDYVDALDRLAISAENEGASYHRIDKDVIDAVLEDLKQSNYTLPDDINESAISDYKIIPGYRTGRGNMIINEGPAQDREAVSKRLLNYTDVENKKILNAEYKKANELMPTMMVVNFVGKDEDGHRPTMTCTIGVKVKVYPVSTTDIVNRITSKVQEKNVLNSFIRATTNDIAFFRDFLFAIDKAKLDAVSYGKGTSNKLWKVLERRATKSKFRRFAGMINDATAITSLCISDDLAKTLKESSGLDIMNLSTARKLLDAYNFMAIIILNEATEVASFLYDTGDDNYERLTFSNMEREASDNSYKKMVNLLAKVSR